MTKIPFHNGDDDNGRPLNKRAINVRRNLGGLHTLLTEKLPDLIDEESGVCNLHKLAKARGMSFQGVYRWFKKRDNNHLPYTQAVSIVELSQSQTSGNATFVPMTIEDIQPFITRT